VPPAEQNFRLSANPVNDDQRRGIPRLDTGVKPDSLSLDQVARYGGHDALTP